MEDTVLGLTMTSANTKKSCKIDEEENKLIAEGLITVSEEKAFKFFKYNSIESIFTKIININFNYY